MKNFYFYTSPLGKLAICDNGKEITHLTLADDMDFSTFTNKETDLIKEAYKQLQEYFEGLRLSFDLPLAPNGTPFQKEVWKALINIPYGETRSYKDIALTVNSPKAYRAVGMANNKNPIMIVIPCHRVIGSNEKLVGYAGGLDIKEFLLNLENKNR